MELYQFIGGSLVVVGSVWLMWLLSGFLSPRPPLFAKAETKRAWWQKRADTLQAYYDKGIWSSPPLDRSQRQLLSVLIEESKAKVRKYTRT